MLLFTLRSCLTLYYSATYISHYFILLRYICLAVLCLTQLRFYLNTLYHSATLVFGLFCITPLIFILGYFGLLRCPSIFHYFALLRYASTFLAQYFITHLPCNTHRYNHQQPLPFHWITEGFRNTPPLSV